MEEDISRRKIMKVAASSACDGMCSGGPAVAATPRNVHLSVPSH